VRTPSSPHISAFNRTLATGVAARIALGAAFFVGLTMLALRIGHAPLAAVLVAGAGGAYAALTWRSLRVSRDATLATDYLARGDLEEAERVLTDSLRQFSLYPRQRLLELYRLALLRQGQGRFIESAELAGAVVTRGAPPAIAVAAGLVRLESLLELGDLHAAHPILTSLMSRGLGLDESARLLASRCRYEAAVGAWDHLLHGIAEKQVLADLMPPGPFVGVQLCFARAARTRGRDDLSRWCVARAVAASGSELRANTGKEFADLADWMEEETRRQAVEMT
jgi:hypothetical protein